MLEIVSVSKMINSNKNGGHTLYTRPLCQFNPPPTPSSPAPCVLSVFHGVSSHFVVGSVSGAPGEGKASSFPATSRQKGKNNEKNCRRTFVPALFVYISMLSPVTAIPTQVVAMWGGE